MCDSSSAGNYFSCRVLLSDCYNLLMLSGDADVPITEATLAAVIALMRRIVEQNTLLDERTARIEDSNTKLDQRTFCILGRLGALESRQVAVTDHNIEWKCPVCGSVLMHGDSFKGHIRKMLPSNSSSRPKCRLRENVERHEVLVHRFEGANFAERAVNFVAAFYVFVRSAITSTFTAAESFAYVSAWLTVAMSSDLRPFPELPRISSSDQAKRPRIDVGDGADEDSP
jgi:hypothetical protein